MWQSMTPAFRRAEDANLCKVNPHNPFGKPVEEPMFTRQQWMVLNALENGLENASVAPDATVRLIPDTGDGYLSGYFILWNGVQGEAERVVESIETDDLYHLIGQGILFRLGRDQYRLNPHRLAEVVHSNN